MKTANTLSLTTPGDLEIKMTRTFNAPRAMVFDALTRPELVKKWFGPPPDTGWTVASCDADLRVGGAWRIEMHRAGPAACTEIILHGVYRELSRPERYVATQLMEGCDGQGDSEAVTTTVLTERGGLTTFTNTIRYPSRLVRDRVLGGATEEAMSAIYDKLAALLDPAAR